MTIRAQVIVKYPESEESLNKALSIFKKKVNREGHLSIARELNKGFKKKSLIKHEKYREIKHNRKRKKR